MTSAWELRNRHLVYLQYVLSTQLSPLHPASPLLGTRLHLGGIPSARRLVEERPLLPPGRHPLSAPLLHGAETHLVRLSRDAYESRVDDATQILPKGEAATAVPNHRK